jgi:hypothetical protein
MAVEIILGMVLTEGIIEIDIARFFPFILFADSAIMNGGTVLI